jgi:hypothetical protein
VTGSAIQDVTAEAERVAEVTTALASVPTLSEVFASKDILTVDMDAARAAILAAEGGPAKSEYQRVVREIESLTQCAPALEATANAEELLELARRYDAAVSLAGSKTRQDLFEAAKKVVEGPDWTDPQQCPVCDTRLEEHIAVCLDRMLERYREADHIAGELENAIGGSPWMAWLESLEGCAALAVADHQKHRNSLTRLAGERRLTEGRLREAIASAQRLEGETGGT